MMLFYARKQVKNENKIFAFQASFPIKFERD